MKIYITYIQFGDYYESKMLIPVRFKYENQPLISNICGVADSLDFRGPHLLEPRIANGFFCLSLCSVNPFKIVNMKQIIDDINNLTVHYGFITSMNHKLKIKGTYNISGSSLSILLPEIRKDIFYENLLELELRE